MKPKAIVLVAAVVVFASALARPALANSTGSLYRQAGDDNGTKATLRGSADLSHNDDSFALSSVRVQQTVAGEGCCGLFQMGWLKLGANISFDGGDIHGPYTGGFVEWEDQNSSILNAVPLTGIGNYGDEYRFTIKHLTSGWQATKENGADVFNNPKSIGFAQGYAMAPSEKLADIGSMTMTWGPSGTTGWQKFDSGSGNWSTISIAFKINSDGQWTIGDAPSPFTIGR